MSLQLKKAQQAYKKKMGESITLTELGRKIGLEELTDNSVKQLLSRWTSGHLVHKVTGDHLKRISFICGISINDLLGFKFNAEAESFENEVFMLKQYLGILDRSKNTVEALTRFNQVYRVGVDFLFSEDKEVLT